MKTDRPHDITSSRMDGTEPLRHKPCTPTEQATLDTPPPEWGVEYRFAGESDTRTHLHIPDPPSREAARAYAATLEAQGGYDLVAVVRLPYDTK